MQKKLIYRADDMIWISVDLVVDLVRTAQVQYHKEASFVGSLISLDKHVYSEVNSLQRISDIDQAQAATYQH